ncbi:hypothetical protein Zm00014a_011795 [Zea mays]|uniref:Uncharacterized protein n=1 Tax=Zea mays TaxID=4577 RepID=A0A3L6F186_MAIZE|nr:hypothetical protein Zm00014a_011795 [Zea mays]
MTGNCPVRGETLPRHGSRHGRWRSRWATRGSQSTSRRSANRRPRATRGPWPPWRRRASGTSRRTRSSRGSAPTPLSKTSSECTASLCDYAFPRAATLPPKSCTPATATNASQTMLLGLKLRRSCSPCPTAQIGRCLVNIRRRHYMSTFPLCDGTANLPCWSECSGSRLAAARRVGRKVVVSCRWEKPGTLCLLRPKSPSLRRHSRTVQWVSYSVVSRLYSIAARMQCRAPIVSRASPTSTSRRIALCASLLLRSWVSHFLLHGLDYQSRTRMGQRGYLPTEKLSKPISSQYGLSDRLYLVISSQMVATMPGRIWCSSWM